MGHLNEVDARIRLVKLVNRLPFYLQGRWRKLAVKRYDARGTYPGIELFLDFLTKATREACDPVFGMNIKSSSNNSGRSVSFQVNGTEKKRPDKKETV